MNESMALDDPLNAYGYPPSIPYNNYMPPANYPYDYGVKHEPNYHPLPLPNPTVNYVPQTVTQPTDNNTHIPETKTTDTNNDKNQTSNTTATLPPENDKRKPKGRTSNYWNVKIDDKDFKFFGCAICNESFKLLSDLDGHISSTHTNERLSSYDLRKLNKLKNKGKKKKTKKKGKKIKQEIGCDIDIKPEDGYIGNEVATDFAETIPNPTDESKVTNNADNNKEDTSTAIDNQKVEKIYKCFGCNKLFAMSYYLRLHVRSHTGEKPYVCKVCGESFITASKRGRHNKRVHLSVRHKCRICFRQFSRFELLTAHFDKRHSEDKLDGEVYDYFAILPYMKELEEELGLKLEQPKKTEDLWGDFDVPLMKNEEITKKEEDKTKVEVDVGAVKDEPNTEGQEEDPDTHEIEGILVEEIKVYTSDEEVKVKEEPGEECGDDGDDGGKERDSASDDDYFPSNTWASSPHHEVNDPPSTKKTNSEGHQTCEICNKVIKTAHYMVIHLRTHTGEKPYKCSVCGVGFITASKMNRHVLTHTEEERKTSSEIVKQEEPPDGEKVKPTKGRPRKKSPKTKKPYRKRPYCCDYCSQTFLFKDTLQVHLKTHQGQSLVYKCRFCLEQLDSKELWEGHEKSHEGPRPYLCTICGKQYMKRETMIYHRKGHEMSNNFTCDICSKTFKAKCQLRRHLAAHTHTKYILRYECPVCAHMFNTKYHIQMHLHTHQKEGLIVEENRNEILAMVLQNARKIPKQPEVALASLPPQPEDDRSRICNICGEIFSHFYYLEEHLKSHGSKIMLLDEEKEEDKKYICTVCNKGFKLHYYLKLHSFTHTKERPYICQQCGKGFITKGKLKRHIETHSGWKKYQCHICCKFFTRPSYLRIHIRTIHGTQDYNFRLDKSYVNDTASSLSHGSILSSNP